LLTDGIIITTVTTDRTDRDPSLAWSLVWVIGQSLSHLVTANVSATYNCLVAEC